MDELYPEPRNTKAILIMKSKRAEEFIRNSAFSAIQLPGEVMYSIHMNVEGKLLDRKSAERAVELAEQDAEEKIEALKARAVEVFRASCPIKHPNLNNKGALCNRISIIGFDCNCPVYDCKFLLNFIQKLNER